MCPNIARWSINGPIHHHRHLLLLRGRQSPKAISRRRASRQLRQRQHRHTVTTVPPPSHPPPSPLPQPDVGAGVHRHVLPLASPSWPAAALPCRSAYSESRDELSLGRVEKVSLFEHCFEQPVPQSVYMSGFTWKEPMDSLVRRTIISV
jgi:hypothetical protein